MATDKYVAWLKATAPPPSLSIMEAGVLARMLDIDVDGITARHMQAQFEELYGAIRAAWDQRPRKAPAKARSVTGKARNVGEGGRNVTPRGQNVPA